MKYTLEAGKAAVWGSKYARMMIILTILAMGFIIFDIHEMGVILYALSGL